MMRLLIETLLYWALLSLCWADHQDVSSHELIPAGQFQSESVIYSCSFDTKDTCGATSITGNMMRTRVTRSEFVSIPGFPRTYYFTDFTSISNQTQKGDRCQIPFTLNNVQHYHCTQSYQCVTQGDNSLQRCTNGYFFSAQTVLTEVTQSASLTFPTINVDRDGDYRVEFSSFIFCNRLTEEDCYSRPDVDLIELSIDNNGIKRKLVSYSKKTRNWAKNSEVVQLNSGSVTISVTFNRHADVSNYQVLFGFDELRLLYVKSGTQVTTTTSTTQTDITSKTTLITTFEPHTPTDYITDKTTTTTPSQSPSTTTTPSSSVEYAFRCDFDSTFNKLCGASISSVNNIKARANKYTLATTAGFPRPYYFTDVTSITNKTQRDDLCQIPFNLNGVQHYHCTQSYQCITQGDSSLQRCANGNFLSGSSSTSTLEQRANITFPTITIEKDGFYEIEYQAFIFCQRLTEQACVATAQDTDAIEVWVVNNDVIRKLQPFSIKRRQWSAQSDSISLSTGDLTISVIFKHKEEEPSLQVIYGFDDLKVFKKNN